MGASLGLCTQKRDFQLNSGKFVRPPDGVDTPAARFDTVADKVLYYSQVVVRSTTTSISLV